MSACGGKICSSTVTALSTRMRASPRTSSNSAVAIEQFGGAVNRVGINDTAFNHRGARYNLLIIGMWPDAAAKTENIAWVRDLWDVMQPYSSGDVYVNYLGQEAEYDGVDGFKRCCDPVREQGDCHFPGDVFIDACAGTVRYIDYADFDHGQIDVVRNETIE